MPFASGLLNSKVLELLATSCLVLIHIDIDTFMADSQHACNMLGSPLNPVVESYIGPDPRVYMAVIATAQGSLRVLVPTS